MTVVHTERGYLESPYLEDAYLAEAANGNLGMQAQLTVTDFPDEIGMEGEAGILEFTALVAMQADRGIGDIEGEIGMEAYRTSLTHIIHGVYLEEPYLEDPYLAARICAIMGQEAQRNLAVTDEIGMQAEGEIEDFEVSIGMQAELVIEDDLAIGMQVDRVQAGFIGMQALSVLYNTTNLRFLCDFDSRGRDIAGGGTNSFGNTFGTGENWIASSTETGDFSPFNLNTDIVEQYWRSATGVVTSVILTCDTEITQGIFLDTLGILNHNLTSSATITMQQADNVGFSGAVSTVLQWTQGDMFWIAPTLPITGYRYVRFVIDDPGNPDGFIRVGTIVFGNAQILQGECFTDVIDFGYKDFADEVNTEGFTNVSNSRALKKLLKLTFRSIEFDLGNFEKLRNMYTLFRTTHKCLWIPTPSDTDMEVTARFAVFSKLAQIPKERHNNRGPDADYVSFELSFDESK